MGALKIKGETSGSTTITAPDSGGDETIELSTALASKLPYEFGTATPTTTDSGFLWYDSNSTPAAPKFWDGSAFVPFGGKILQVVRATDTTTRNTTSTTFVDASISVTITPQKSDSAILLVWTFFAAPANNDFVNVQITDNSNNPISGAEAVSFGSSNATVWRTGATLVAYATPAVTTAVTHKGRFRGSSGGNASIANATTTGQLYAIEVSA